MVQLYSKEPRQSSIFIPLKSVDGKVVGYTCIECGRLHTAPHFDTCSFSANAKPSYEELERQLAEAKRDSARLDWLLPQLSGRDLRSLGVIYEAATPFWFRKAIDAAMSAADSRESECPK